MTIITDIQSDGDKYWVNITVDKDPLKRRGPFASRNEAEELTARVHQIARVLTPRA
jgi:hypothetical protein